MITKKQAFNKIKKWASKKDRIPSLCYTLPIELKHGWNMYWKKINTKDHGYIYHYFDDFVQTTYLAQVEYEMTHKEEIDLLRLLTLYYFIEDTYKTVE